MAYFWLVLSGLCSVAASIALKIAANTSNTNQTISILSIQGAFPYICAMVFYGLGFGLYALALKKLDLSLAYPLMVGISILGILAYGVLSGNELVSSSRIAGALLVMVGIFLLNR